MNETNSASATPPPASTIGDDRVVKAILIAAIAVGFFLRAYKPGADSPSWYYVFNSDEAHYSYCVQNKLEFGHFFLNDAKYSLAYPLFTAVQYVCAAAWGEDWGLARYRFVSIAAGIALCFLLGLFFKRGWPRLAAMAMSAISFMGIVHSRYGIPEMLLAATMTATILIVNHGWRTRKSSWWFAAGAAGVACVAVKTTGILMLPALLLIPILSHRTKGDRWRYYRFTLGGMVLAGMLYVVAAVLPDPAAWLYFQKSLTAYARETQPHNPFDFMNNIVSLILSPALRTTIILWIAAMGWAALVFLPKLLRRKVEPDEAALMAWLLGCVCILSTTTSQPARWVLLMFPPVIILGLRFFLDAPNRRLAIGVFILAIVFSFVPLIANNMATARNYPASAPAVQRRLAVLFLVSAVACMAGVLYARYRKRDWRTVLLWGAISLEFVWQGSLIGVHVIPAYSRPDHWMKIAAEVRALNSAGDMCIGGQLVQDLALRTKVRTIPIYYVLTRAQIDDEDVYRFFSRQNPRPTHLMLTSEEVDEWNVKVPALMKHAEPVFARKHVSGEGIRTLCLLKIDEAYWH